MPQTRSSRIPDPIGVEGADGSSQASDANPVPTSTVVAGAPVDPRAVRALLSGTDSITIVPSGTQNVDVTANTVGLATSAKQDAQQTALDGIKTGTDKIPASPSQEAATGAATPSSVTPVGGSDGTNLQAMRVDADGHVQVDVLEGGGGGTEPVYQASALTDVSPNGTTVESAGNASLFVHAIMDTGASELVVEESNDDATWNSIGLIPIPDSQGPENPDTTPGVGTTGIFRIGSVSGRYVRARGVGLDAGETLTVKLFLTPSPSRQVWTIGRHEIDRWGGSLVSPSGNGAVDGLSAALGGPMVRSFLYGFNGTAWDRLRSSILNGLVVDVSRSVPLGAATDAEATGDGSLIAITKRIRTLTNTIASKDFAQQTTLAQLKTRADLLLAKTDFEARINTLGQKTSAQSTPVVLPSDQTVPVSVASLPLPAGAATSAKQDTQQSTLDAIQSGSLQNGTETTVDATAGGVQLIAANATRKSLTIQNVGAANMRVGVSGVTATAGMRIVPGGHVIFSAPAVTNAVFAIREGAVSTTALAQEAT